MTNAEAGVAIGRSTRVTGAGGMAMGGAASAVSTNSVALGINSLAGTAATGGAAAMTDAVAVGARARATGAFSSAIGVDSRATGQSSIALGDAAASGQTGAVAVGRAAQATQASALALGSATTAGQANAVALGANSVTAAPVSTTGGTIAGTPYNFAGTAPGSTVSIGAAGSERTLTNLAAGRLSTTSTDAINGSQLNATNTELTALDTRTDTLGANVARNLGGGAGYDATTGTVSAPSYSVGGSSVNNVGDAVKNLDDRTTANTNSLGTISNGGGIKYFHANSTKADSTASATDSIAVGPNAVASQAGATAIGLGATSANANAVALGTQARATGPEAIAIGRDSASTGVGAVALGNNAKANSASSIAMGQNSTAGTTAGNAGWAIGYTAQATGNFSMALGQFVTASGASSVAMGVGSQATAQEAMALGHNAIAGQVNAVALGQGATASHAGAMALGAGSVTAAPVSTTSGTIAGTSYAYAGNVASSTASVGSDSVKRTITNVAAGRVSATSTDAVNGSQLDATHQAVTSLDGRVDTLGANAARNLGGGSAYDPATGTLSAPSYSVGGSNVNNVGDALKNLDGRTTTNTTAIDSLNNGGGIRYFHANSTRADSAATGTDSIAIGPAAAASVTNAVAIGNGAIASHAGSLALGSGARTADAVATASGSIAGNNHDYAGAAPTSTVSVGDAGTERTLTNVAAGRVNATSTDAINGSQLDATNTELTALDTRTDTLGNNVARNLGGGSTYDANTGTLSAPGYAVDGKQVNTVGDAVSNLDGRTTGNTNAITQLGDQLNSGSTGLVQLARDAANKVTGVTVAKAAGGNNVDFAGTDGVRKLVGVAPGAVSAGSVEAVNGSQLFTTNQAVTDLGTRTSALGGDVARNLGGGAAYDPATGKVSAPSYSVGGSTVNNVGDAVSNLDGRTTRNTAAIDNLNAGGGIRYFHASSTRADSTATGADSIAVGPQANASAANAVALGNGATASHAGSLALGNGARTAAAVATVSGTVAGNSHDYAGTAPLATLSIGDAGSERTLTNLAAGRISATSTDAINGSQLHATNTELTALDTRTDALGANTARNLGGGSAYDPATGALSAPNYSVDGKQVNTVGDAVSNLDGRTTGNTNAITQLGDQLSSGSTGLVQLARDTDNKVTGVTVAKAEGGSNVDFAGIDGARKLVGVDEGAVSATSVEAINGAQLQAVSQSVANNLGGGARVNPDGSVSAPSYGVGGGTVNNVGDAVSNLDGRTTSNTNAISQLGDQLNNGGTGLVQLSRDVGNKVTGVTVAKDAGGTAVDFTGTEGVRRLVGVAPGGVSAASTEAVNGSQLFTTNQAVTDLGTRTSALGGDVARNLGGGAAYDPATGKVSAPNYSVGGTTVGNVGDAVSNLDGRTTRNTTAIDSLNNGGGIKYFHAGSTRADSTASGIDSVAVGPAAMASAGNAVAIGNGATASHAGSLALGSGATTAEVVATASGTVAGSRHDYAGSAPTSTLSIGSAGAERTVTNLAAGRISATSTDAINGSQLHATNTELTALDTRTDTLGANTARNLGGGSSYDPATGMVSAPSYSVGGGTVDNVGGAVSNLDGRTTGNTTAITQLGDQLNNGSTGLVQLSRDADNKVIGVTVAKAAGGNTVDFAGTDGARKLVGVEKGAVNATSSEAVNGSQLFSTNQAVTDLGTKTDALGNNVASSFGGGSTYDPVTGKVTTPGYMVDGKQVNTVGDAVSNLDGRTTGNTNAITQLGDQLNNGTTGLVQLSRDADNKVTGVTVAKAAGGNTVDFTGTDGARRLVGVGDASIAAGSKEAVNGGQVQGISQSLADALGGGARVNPDGTVSAPGYSVGGNTVNSVGDAISNVDGRTTANTNAISAISNGGGIKYFHASSTLADSTASGTDSMAMGPAAAASATNAVAIGHGATASDANSMALGNGARTAAAVATSSGAIAGTPYAYAGTAPTGTVSIGDAGSERTLTNVAAGRVNATSTDAINGSQLNATHTELAALDARADTLGGNVASHLGGGSTYDPVTGKVTAPGYMVDGKQVNTVGDAVSNLDGRTTGNTNAITQLGDQLNNGTTGLVQLSRDADNKVTGVTVAKAAGGNTVDFTGTDGARRLVGVGDASIAAGSKEAVNGGQVQGISQSLADALGGGARVNPDGTVSAPGYSVGGNTVNSVGDAISNVDGRVSSVEGAIAGLNSGGGIKYFRASSTRADAVASGTDSVAVGPQANAAASNSVAIGNGASAEHVDSIALGSGTRTTVGAQDSYDGAFVGSSSSRGEVAVGGRKLTGVAAGSADTDGVNVSQLKAGVTSAVDQAKGYTDARITEVAGSVGNAAAAVEDLRKGADGMFQVGQDGGAKPAASGTNAVAGGSNAQATGADSTALGANSQASGNNSVALGARSIADRDNTVAVGSAGNERQVTHVAAGTQDSDAVNVSQLRQSTAGTVRYDSNADGSVNPQSMTLNAGGAPVGVHNVADGVRPDDAVNMGQLGRAVGQLRADQWDARRESRGGTASAMAMAGMPQASGAGRHMLAVGMGGYEGEVGMAVGMSGVTDNGRYVYKAQMSGNTSRDFGFSVGAGIQW